MPTITANGIDIAYEIDGSPDQPVLLLIHGFASPLTAWPEGFVKKLVDDGFCVLRFDNRDVGKSEKLHGLGIPNITKLWLMSLFGLRGAVPYSLDDMMQDAQGLLTALKIDKVHVVGASMGGMIAQLLALQTPEKVQSLTSIMSTTGNRKVPGPTKQVAKHLRSKPAEATIESLVEFMLKSFRLIGSPAYVTPQDEQIEYIKGIIQRGLSGPGAARHTAAIIAAPSRAKRLRTLQVPTLVIHGDADPLVNVAGAYDTASAIPNAQLEIIPGMGHDFPPQLHDKICSMVSAHVRAH